MSGSNWKSKLKDARKLRGDGAAILFRRIKLLVDIAMDKGFLADCEAKANDPVTAMDYEVEDVGADFQTCKAVFEANPTVEAWRKHGFRYLLAEWIRDHRETAEGRAKVSYKALYQEALAEIDRLKSQIAKLKAGQKVAS